MRVLIIDDAVVYRMALSQALKTEDGIEVVKSVSNGAQALEYLKSDQNVDLVIVDMEMPVMDGLATIKAIREFNKTVVIVVFSSTTVTGAEKTLKALELGANDFVTKQEASSALSLAGSMEMIKQILVPKIRAFERLKSKEAPAPPASKKSFTDETLLGTKLICIGASTGGPVALSTIFRSIKEAPNVPILLVQHMPPVFTAKLAEMLDSLTSKIKVVEAKEGQDLLAGHCYVAPGDYHMELTKDFKLTLNQNEKVCFVRPSVDVLFNSVAANYKGQVLGLVLTGMGEDGAKGSLSLKENGAHIFVQDKPSSVVWGMPGAVIKINNQARELPLEEIAPFLDSIFKRV